MDSSMVGTYTTSTRVSAGDVAISLPDEVVKYAWTDNSSGTAVTRYTYYTALFITVETNDVRIRFGDDPSQGTEPEGHVFAKDTSFRVVGKKNVENLKIIAATQGNTSLLQVSVE